MFVAAHSFAVEPTSLLLSLPSSLGQKRKVFITNKHASCEARCALELTRGRLGTSILGEAFVACLIECEISYLDEAEEQDGRAEEESQEDRHNNHQVAKPQNIAADTQLDQRTVCTVGAWCNQRLQTTDDDGDKLERQRHQKYQKAVVVVDTNAVVEPRTMMVKAFNTAIANGAVAGARGAQDCAIWTHLTRVYLLKQFEEVV